MHLFTQTIRHKRSGFKCLRSPNSVVDSATSSLIIYSNYLGNFADERDDDELDVIGQRCD